jgi:hypothetical protein
MIERAGPLKINVDNPLGGNDAHSIRIEKGWEIRHHPYFKDIGDRTMAVIRNKDGFVIGGLEVEEDFLKAEVNGGAERRIARIDVCDALKISQDIVDN